MTLCQSALVTGATGFLGSVLVERLVAERVEITALVRSNERATSLRLLRGVNVIEVNSWDVATLTAKLKGVHADVVFHLASYGVQQNQRDQSQLIDGNIGLVTGLLQAAADLPLRRFIHTGSCSEYGFPDQEGALVAETQPIRPKSPYGAAKAASVLCGNALACSLGIPFVTLRLFGVFGTREGPDRLVPYVISRLLNHQPVDLTWGEQVRDFLFEDDVAEAFLAAASADGLKSGEIYNVCSSRATRIRSLGELVADVMEKPRDLLRWGQRPYRPDEPMWMVGDCRRFQEATGSWSAKISLPEGIRRMIDHARHSRGQEGMRNGL